MIGLLLGLLPTLHAQDGIVPVAAGETVTAAQAGFLLPEPHYNQCLVNTLTLRGVETALTQCVATGTDGLEAAQVTLGVCEQTLIENQSDLTVLYARIERRDDTIERLKHQRNVAYAVGGGVTLGAVAAIALSVALGPGG